MLNATFPENVLGPSNIFSEVTALLLTQDYMCLDFHQAPRSRCVQVFRVARLGPLPVAAMGLLCPARRVALRGATAQDLKPKFQHYDQ